jgi:hypothetical protein
MGQSVKVSSSFAVDDVATDPTTVTLVVKDPEGEETTYTYALGEITRVSAGVYTKDISPDMVGTWWYWFYGTGACAAASQQKFYVKSQF